MNTYLALDLGGTKLMIAEVTADGEILCNKQYKSAYPNQQEGVAGILESLDDYCQSVGFKETPVMIGMGLTGKVDHKRNLAVIGTYRSGSNPACRYPDQKMGLPAVLDNDMHSAAMAELLLGCGKYCDDFIYLNIGTGLAAGLVSDRHVIHGVNNMSGEIGHTSIGINQDVSCGCGKSGCCERTVSGIGFDAQARRLSPHIQTARFVSPKIPAFGSQDMKYLNWPQKATRSAPVLWRKELKRLLF